ncbi:tetratricopeptide repeat protein [candidate division KSB1 bacterium]|nr:tetratricopeptide repeat protein [candidate division KSB1 bacterium]
MRRIYAVAALSLLVLFSAIMMFGCRSKEVESALIYINQQNDWDKAMEQLQQAVQVNPADAEAHVYLGEGYGRRGDYRKMNEHYETAMKLLSAPGSANTKLIDKITNDRNRFWSQSFNKGVENVKRDSLQSAIADFNNCVAIDPSRGEAHKNIAYVNERMENFEDAVKAYEEVIRIAPQDTLILIHLGRLYMLTKQPEKTIELMDRVLALDPMNVDAISQKAMAYDYLEQSDKAFEAYEDALERRPDDPDLRFNLGRLYFMRDDFTNAVIQFEKVLEINPDDLEANVNIANSYLSLAQNVLTKYREMTDKELAKVPEKEIKEKKNLEKEYYGKSIPYLEKAVQVKPDDPILWNNLGVAYVNAGMEEKGKAAFDKSEALKNE